MPVLPFRGGESNTGAAVAIFSTMLEVVDLSLFCFCFSPSSSSDSLGNDCKAVAAVVVNISTVTCANFDTPNDDVDLLLALDAVEAADAASGL